MLAVSGLAKQPQPTIKEIAAQLRLEHHTVVELAGGLVKTEPPAKAHISGR